MNPDLRKRIDKLKADLPPIWSRPARFGTLDEAQPVAVAKPSKPELPHGLSRYTHHPCRCAVCTMAFRDYARSRRRKSAPKKTQPAAPKPAPRKGRKPKPKTGEKRRREGSPICPVSRGKHRFCKSGNNKYGPLMKCSYCDTTRMAVPDQMVGGREA